MKNRHTIAQSVIVFETLTKGKVMLDQLREGLAALGFGFLMQKFPDLFEKLFVVSVDVLYPSVDGLLDLLKPPPCMDEEQSSTFLFLSEYVRQLDPQGIRILKK